MLITDSRAIGERLYALRKKQGLTQAEIAAAAGISDHTYAVIERGEADMRVKTLLALCKVLNASPNDIFIDDSISLSPAEITARLAALPDKEKLAVSRLIDYLSNI